MSRKRLSDLVREEVGREASTVEVDTDLTSESGESTIPESRGETAQLEAKVADLIVDLEAARGRESAISSQVVALEAELEAQKDLVRTLSEKLEKTETLEVELAEQKALVNKLYSELQEAQTVAAELAEQKQLVEKLYTELEQLRQPVPESPAPEKSQKLARKPDISSAMEPRPVGGFTVPPQPSPRLSNEDIGWFD
jgi:chromosome segregation ATPase